MGQYGPYNMPTTARREVAFRLIDENGFHVVNAGKKFPFTISDLVVSDGMPIQKTLIKGTAISDEDSIVRVGVDVPMTAGEWSLMDKAVNGVLSLWGVNGTQQYPIFTGRRLLFTVPPASPFPLDLQAIWEQYDADKYAADTAAQDEIMAQKYAQMIASEAEAKAAADKAKAAADAAAAKKQAADDAIAAATNEQTSKDKMLWTVGGLAALGLLGILAFMD
jgi:hypothetical protein